MDYQQRNKTITAISIITILGGLTVMCGWILDISPLESIVNGFVAMKFNAALCFVLLGCALLLTQFPLSKYPITIFIILSLLSSLIGMVTLLQDVFHFTLGVDQLFVTDKTPVSPTLPFPGRMAFNASFSFFFVGLGFFALASKKEVYYKVSQVFFQTVSVISVIVLIGYLYGARLFSTLFFVTSMATHTAILFFILSVGASLLNPSIGIARLFTGTGVGNKMAKRLSILMITMVVMFGSFHGQVQTQHFQLFSFETAVSLLAVCFLLASLALIWNTANWLNRIDQQRSAAEAEVKLMNIELEKRVEERAAELKEAELKFRTLAEKSMMGVYIVHNGVFTYVNPRFANIFGLQPIDLLNIPNAAAKIFHPNHLEKVNENVRRRIDGEVESIRYEAMGIKSDGTTNWVEVYGNRVIIGDVPAIIGSIMDITERKQAEESLQKSEANLQSILNTTDTAYALFDTEFNVVEYNQKATGFIKKHYYHFPKAGDKLTDFFPLERFPQFIHYTRTVLKGDSINFEIDFQQEDGSTLWYDIRLFPITNDNKEILGLMTALYDITERKNAEQDLKNAYQRIQRHINSIKDMAWKQSHLIRSPLANLKGLTEMLKDDPGDADVLEFVQAELNRMDGIIIEMAADMSEQGI